MPIDKKTNGTKKLTRTRARIKTDKKVVPKRVVATKAKVKSRATKPVSKKSRLTNKASIDKVVVPTNMSLRAIDKTQVLKAEFSDILANSVYLVAYTAAVCFLLVGSAVALTNLSISPQSLKAETYSSTSDSGGTSDPQVEQTDFATVTFLSEMPENIIDTYLVKYQVTNAERVTATLVSIGSNQTHDLPAKKVSEDTYRTIIQADKLNPGYYRLKIYVKQLNQTASFAKVTKEFHIGLEEGLAIESPSLVLTTTDENVEIVSGQADGADGAGLQTDGTLGADSEITSSNNEDEATPETKTEADMTLDTQEDGGRESAEEPVNESKVTFSVEAEEGSLETHVADRFELQAPEGLDLSGTAIIKILPQVNYTYLELYARPTNSLTARFVTLAVNLSDKWGFVVNTSNLPNGEYEFFAKTKLPQSPTLLKSKSIKLRVKNEPVLMSSPLEIIAPAVVEVSNSTEVAEGGLSEPTIEKREILPLLEGDSAVVSLYPDKVSAGVDLLLKQNEKELGELLQHYAVAQQTKNEMLVDSVRQLLQEKREEIALKALDDSDLRFLSGDIDAQLKIKLDQLEKKVEVFEEIRNKRSGGKSAIDTDKDGVADVDEINLYGTDPNQTDSDNDGVADGVEIIRGYSPTDSKVEALIVYQSPKEAVGVPKSKLLLVEEILPVKKTSSANVTTVLAEIRGQALPNSFVTLYIFSSPTVVTVKTDDDGAFVYTFEKELEDGLHEVFVAVTDNAGEIVAQSNPFSFIKEAEAFTPVGATENNVVTVDTIIESNKSPYNVAVGVGIIAFGIILLMLGISLRTSFKSKPVF